MDDETLLDRLRQLIGNVIGGERMPSGVGADVALGEGGLWLDSVELLQVTVAAEAEFGIIFEPAKDLVGEGLETVGTFASMIQRRSGSLSAAAPPPKFAP